MGRAASIGARTFLVTVCIAWTLSLLAASAAEGAGPVVGWGAGAPPPAISASAIAVGGNYRCAIQAGSGAVVCWGDNWEGATVPPPAVDGTSGTASAIAAGGVHSCAIRAGTSAVICWGYNSNGQATPPPSVDGTSGTASAIAAGGLHTLALPEPNAMMVMTAAAWLLRMLAKRRLGARRSHAQLVR
jgi:hypothetical protein